MSPDGGPSIRVVLRAEWAAPAGQGLLAGDARVRTLCRVLVTYPGVRHVVPDGVRLEAGVDAGALDSLVRLLQRQQWLVASVAVDR